VCQVTLSDSHISLEMVSRAPRAFSRAAATAPAMELGSVVSKASRSSASPLVSRVSTGGCAPRIAISDRHAASSSAHGSSSSRARNASRMRAVSSARST
jgi:hypothetical protein